MIVERNGCKLYYEVTEPEGAAGEVPTVIFTHGVGSGSLLWQYQVGAAYTCDSLSRLSYIFPRK